ncbi:MAG TPA: hypothetical protein VH394_11980 [Thermoanaerobaculia bacterium]|jgi:hypothetical protein|nr:hypothetical protein [Thermoanaerobaculia bacterium]
MASPKRTNLISLLALLLLVGIVAVTPETRIFMGRVADWIAGVRKERAEIRQREAEQEAREAAAQETVAAEATPAPPPPHTFLDEDGLYQPDPGYWWVDNDPAKLEVEWRPGTLHPDDPRVVASSEPDQWAPAPGYEWVAEKGVNDLRVAWKPGKPHAIFGHVLAAEKEGEWTPAPGYEWVNDDPNDLTVVPENGGS